MFHLPAVGIPQSQRRVGAGGDDAPKRPTPHGQLSSPASSHRNLWMSCCASLPQRGFIDRPTAGFVRRSKPVIEWKCCRSAPGISSIERSGFAAAWGSGLRGVRGRGAGRGWMNSDGIPWDWPAIVAGFSAYARKAIAIYRSFSRAEADPMIRPSRAIAMGTPALPHPTANRLVQKAFLIGFAIRKA